MTTFDPVKLNNARAKVQQLRTTLRVRLEKTNNLLGRANKSLWLDLGKIFEEEARISRSEILKQALIEEVNEQTDVKALASWDAADKSVFENLLVLAMGYDDKESLRSLYAKALRNAAAKGVARKEKAFADWVEKEHGIVNAANAGGASQSAASKPADVIAAFKASLPPVAKQDRTIPLKLDVGETGLAVALLEPLPDGQSRVLLMTNAAAAVASVITATTPKALKRSQIERIERDALWYLNRLVFKESKVIRRKARVEDAILFQKAFRNLKRVPELREKFFDGEAGFACTIDSLKQTFKFEVANPTFHALDPGRYIKGAKERALVPYEFDPKQTVKIIQDSDPLIAYLQGRPKRSRRQSSSSTANSIPGLEDYNPIRWKSKANDAVEVESA
jgi:hypothetical protein